MNHQDSLSVLAGLASMKKIPTTGVSVKEVLRKVSHSAIERKRRDKINERLTQLKALVPSCASKKSSGATLHKLTVLEETIKYIQELEGRIAHLEGKQVTPHSPPYTCEPASPSSSASSISSCSPSNPSRSSMETVKSLLHTPDFLAPSHTSLAPSPTLSYISIDSSYSKSSTTGRSNVSIMSLENLL